MKTLIKNLILTALAVTSFSSSLRADDLSALYSITSSPVMTDYTAEVILAWDGTTPGVNPPVALDAAACGAVYLVEDDQNAGFQYIRKLAPDGGTVATWGSDRLVYVRDLHVNCTGNIYVLDQNWSVGTSIFVYTSTGSFIAQYPADGTLGWSAGDPAALATDGNGNIYVLDAACGQAGVIKLDANGQFVAKWSAAGDQDLIAPTALALDASGYVYVGDFEADWMSSRVVKYDTNGNYLTTIRGAGDDLIHDVTDLKATLDGRVVVGDMLPDGSSRLLVFNSQVASTAAESASADWSMFQGGDLALPADDRIFVLDAGRSEGRVIRFTSIYSQAGSRPVSPAPLKTFEVAGDRACVLAPSLARGGASVCLVAENQVRQVKVRIYNLNGEKVGELTGGAFDQACWNTQAVAPGVYVARMESTRADGTLARQAQKIAVIR